jgi:hypothetical protein
MKRLLLFLCCASSALVTGTAAQAGPPQITGLSGTSFHFDVAGGDSQWISTNGTATQNNDPAASHSVVSDFTFLPSGGSPTVGGVIIFVDQENPTIPTACGVAVTDVNNGQLYTSSYVGLSPLTLGRTSFVLPDVTGLSTNHTYAVSIYCALPPYSANHGATLLLGIQRNRALESDRSSQAFHAASLNDAAIRLTGFYVDNTSTTATQNAVADVTAYLDGFAPTVTVFLQNSNPNVPMKCFYNALDPAGHPFQATFTQTGVGFFQPQLKLPLSLPSDTMFSLLCSIPPMYQGTTSKIFGFRAFGGANGAPRAIISHAAFHGDSAEDESWLADNGFAIVNTDAGSDHSFVAQLGLGGPAAASASVNIDVEDPSQPVFCFLWSYDLATGGVNYTFEETYTTGFQIMTLSIPPPPPCDPNDPTCKPPTDLYNWSVACTLPASTVGPRSAVLGALVAVEQD